MHLYILFITSLFIPPALSLIVETKSSEKKFVSIKISLFSVFFSFKASFALELYL
jgi:hypothetical protein